MESLDEGYCCVGLTPDLAQHFHIFFVLSDLPNGFEEAMMVAMARVGGAVSSGLLVFEFGVDTE